ncbi:hypothetical protein JB92DRAFT_2899941 [Gautieria morchelliformis]|nr:hypothetical protein JB92DRAFT_2899941 [Gautieria morchelliformis]
MLLVVTSSSCKRNGVNAFSPNWALRLMAFQTGPSSGVITGSFLVIIERQNDYITAAIAKWQRETQDK